MSDTRKVYEVKFNDAGVAHVVAEDIEQALKAFIDPIREKVSTADYYYLGSSGGVKWNGVRIKSITQIDRTAVDIIIAPSNIE